MPPVLQVMALFTSLAFAEPPSVAQLIEELGNPRFKEREAASQKLKEVGEPALEQLRAAARTHNDAEIRQRAKRIIQAIEARLCGRWTLIRAEPASLACELQIESGMLALKKGTEVVKASLELGWVDGRKTFDFLARAGDRKLYLLRGIYDVRRDTLTLCWTASDNFEPRPEKLESMKAPATSLAVFKRAKD